MKQLLLALLLLANLAQAQNYEVLFIGNSYTYVNNLPDMLAQLANANGDTLTHDSSTPGGYYFRAHSTNTTTLSKISSRPWDFVILQEQSQIPSLSPAIVGNDWSPPHARTLDSLIKANNSCTETVFYMTWGRKNGDASYCAQQPPVCTFEGMQGQLRSTYLIMADENNSTVAPVGMAWRAAIQADSMLELYSPDQSHPGTNGTYLTACVFYATLYRKSPVGIPFYSSVDTVTAQFLQGIAEQIVFDSMDIWRIGHADLVVDFGYQALSGLDYQFTNNSSNQNGQLWNFDGSTDTNTNPTFSFPAPGLYNISLRVWNDCDTLLSSRQINVTASGFHQSPQKTDIQVFPNPTPGSFVVQSDAKNPISSIKIYNSLGQLVYQQNEQAKTMVPLHLALPAGNYYIQFNNQKERSKQLTINY